jgi:hypothetical protein
MIRFLTIFIVVGIAVAMNTAGCSRSSKPEGMSDADFKKLTELPSDVKEIFENADQIELYSIKPHSVVPVGDKSPEVIKRREAGFLGYEMNGKVSITDNAKIKEVSWAIQRDIAEYTRRASCFEPRHGIRATQGSKKVDFLICYACSIIYYYSDNGKDHRATTSGSSRPTLDKILNEAGIKPNRDPTADSENH